MIKIRELSQATDRAIEDTWTRTVNFFNEETYSICKLGAQLGVLDTQASTLLQCCIQLLQFSPGLRQLRWFFSLSPP